jgi:hypothetical protein
VKGASRQHIKPEYQDVFAIMSCYQALVSQNKPVNPPIVFDGDVRRMNDCLPGRFFKTIAAHEFGFKTPKQ